MTKQTIFIGQTANDRTGDPLRTAFEKVNSNFDELYARTGDDIQIPALAGNTGKVLTTNGTTLSWSASNSFNQSLNTTNSVTFNSVASSTVNVSQINGTNPGNELIIQANSRNWVFGTDGTLTLPNLGTVTNPSVGGGTTGTIYTFTVSSNAGGSESLVDAIRVQLSSTIQTQSVGIGWIITFASGLQKTLTNSAAAAFPGGWDLTWSGSVNLSSSDVWPLTVQSADYAVGTTTKSLELTPDGTITWTFNSDGTLSLPNTGSIQQKFVETKVTQSNIILNASSGVIWTANNLYASGAKLIIQAEIDETGDATGWHSQVCEAIIASRGYASSASGPLGDPHMTVYGVTHTSTDPLITFTVQRDPVTNLIEVTGTRTATAVSSARVDFRIHSVEMSTSD
jgi:hypothetical protein